MKSQYAEDRSFKAYCAQSQTMQILASNRRLWKLNLCLAVASFLPLIAR